MFLINRYGPKEPEKFSWIHRNLLKTLFGFIPAVLIVSCTQSAKNPVSTTESIPENIVGTASCLKDMGTYCLLGGDMILDKRNENHRAMIACLNGDSSSSNSLAKTTSFQKAVKTWPGGVVKYVMKSGFTSTEQSEIRKAMDSISLACGVTWKGMGSWYDWDPYYMISPGTSTTEGGSSTYGYGTFNHVTFTSGKFDWRSAAHEFMHALGYIHEHQRSDRPITINMGNIQDDYVKWFEPVPDFTYPLWIKTRNATRRGNYDYESITHYASTAFSKNGNITIEAGAYNTIIGKKKYISYRDKYGLRAVYGNPSRFGVTSYISNGTSLSNQWQNVNMGGRAMLAWKTGDVNGDKKTDLILPWNNGGKLTVETFLSNGSGFTWSSSSINSGGTNFLAWLTGDVNGDGKTDLILPWNNGGKLTVETFLSNGSGFTWSSSSINSGGTNFLAWLTGDVNGDGKTDLILPWNNGGKLTVETFLSNGSGFTWSSSSINSGGTNFLAWLTGDVNGDGKTDLILPWNNGGKLTVETFLSYGPGFIWSSSSINSGGTNFLAWLTGDVNGDGKTDLILPWNNGGKLTVETFLSYGPGFIWSSSSINAGGTNFLAWQTGDVNGDKKTDLILPWDNGGRMNVEVYNGNGSGFSYGSTAECGMVSTSLPLIAGDINGDDRSDMISFW